MMFFGGWMIIVWIGIIIIFGLAVWGVIALTRQAGSTPDRSRKTPLDIAKERYARGEITKEEFERIKRDLT